MLETLDPVTEMYWRAVEEMWCIKSREGAAVDSGIEDIVGQLIEKIDVALWTGDVGRFYAHARTIALSGWSCSIGQCGP